MYSAPKSSALKIGRTSSTWRAPYCGSVGQRFAHSTASSKELTSQSQ